MKRIWLRTAGHGRLFEPVWSWENSLPEPVLRAKLWVFISDLDCDGGRDRVVGGVRA